MITIGFRAADGSPYTVQLIPFLLFLNMLLALNWLVFLAVAVNRAATGRLFTYPLTLQRPRWRLRPARPA